LACGPGKFVLRAEFAGLWIQDTLRQKIFPVSVQDILKRGGSGFMETYVQEELWHLKTFASDNSLNLLR
jgi:hypothetical protein